MKKRIRLTESQLTKLINESIMEMLKEKYPINANSFSAAYSSREKSVKS